MIQHQERVSCFTHLAGAFIAFAGTVYLLVVVHNSPIHLILGSIYGFSMVFLFTASSLYHALKQGENSDSFWRKLDHSAIFIMIAGTYTPICYIYLIGSWRWALILVQWGLVIAGLGFKFFYIKAPRYVSTVIYLLMGWAGLAAIKELMAAMPSFAVLNLFAGGVAFTVGAVFYALKKPVIRPGFGFHEIFHLFILIGAAFHYLLVYTALTGGK